MSAIPTLPPALHELAVNAVRGKPSALGAGHDCTPSMQSILEAFKTQGNNDRAMLLALLQAKKAEDERLAALSYALAVQALTVVASQRQVASPSLFVPEQSRSGSVSSVSSAQSVRSSASDDESVATSVSGSSKSASRKRKSPAPVENVPTHAEVMTALKAKLQGRAGSPPAPVAAKTEPAAKRRKSASPPIAQAPTLPSLFPRTVGGSAAAASSLQSYHLPLSTGPSARPAAATPVGPSESEKFRASLNLLNIAAERLAGNWQTSDVRGQTV